MALLSIDNNDDPSFAQKSRDCLAESVNSVNETREDLQLGSIVYALLAIGEQVNHLTVMGRY